MELREKGGYSFDIEVDGGIKKDNLEMVLDAGANVIVAGSAIFKDDIEKNTEISWRFLRRGRHKWIH